MEREVGGGIRMGKTCKLKAVSFQCMTKFTTNLKKKKFFSHLDWYIIFFNLFLVGGKRFYSVVLVSAMQQHKSLTIIHTSPYIIIQ